MRCLDIVVGEGTCGDRMSGDQCVIEEAARTVGSPRTIMEIATGTKATEENHQ